MAGGGTSGRQFFTQEVCHWVGSMVLRFFCSTWPSRNRQLHISLWSNLRRRLPFVVSCGQTWASESMPAAPAQMPSAKM